MTIPEAINFVDIARMNYICDPKECGLEKGKDPCTAFHCDEMHDALAMATEALEKQIPKKPINEYDNYAGGILHHCPNCNASVQRHGMFGGLFINPMHCMCCGQAIDWGDNNG